MTRKMKDSGIEWIGAVPEEWRVMKNKRLFKKVKTLVGEGFNTYQLLSLTTKGVKQKDIDNPEGKLPESFSTYQSVEKDNIVLCLFDLDVSAVFSGRSEYSGMISSAYSVVEVNDLMIPEYAEFFFKMAGHKRNYIMYSKSLRRTINQDIFKEIESIVPSRKEQEAINFFLKEKSAHIDSIINDTKQSIEEFKKYKEAVIIETVTKGLNSNVKMKHSGIDWIGQIPVNWNTLKIKYVLAERSEKTKLGTEEPLSMSQRFGVIPTKDMNSIPNPTSSYVGSKVVRRNDLVFNKLKAHLGVFSTSMFNGIVSPDYAVYYPKTSVNVKYLEYLFKTPLYINEFKRFSRGVAAGFTRLYTPDLFNIWCILPNLEEQDEIVNHINNSCSRIDELVIQKQQLITELENYKSSLIYEYVTGKKEVM